MPALVHLTRIRGVYYADLWDQDARRRHRVSLYTRDAAEAEVRLVQFRRDIAPRLVKSAQDARSAKIAAVIDYYVDIHLVNRRAASKTVDKARQVLDDFRRYCAVKRISNVEQLSRRTVDEYAAMLASTRTAKTIESYLGFIRAALNVAVEAGLISRSPIPKYPRPRVQEFERDVLTASELRDLLAVTDGHERIAGIVRWLALTGNRPSDAVSLRWQDIDLDAGYVERRSVKTKRLARYPLSAPAVELLRALPRRGPLVFYARDGVSWTPNTLYKAFRRAVVDYARPVTLYTLRHTFGTLLANADPPCPLPLLQQLMGHRDIDTTMRYVRPMDARSHLDQYAATIRAVAAP